MKITTKMVTINSFIVALLIIFTFVPQLGYITIGPIQITLMHIWFLIGMETLYLSFNIQLWLSGIVYGLLFGLSSWLQALMIPSVPSFIFVNPLFSIVPRLLMGLGVGLVATIVEIYHQRLKLQNLKQSNRYINFYLKYDQMIVAFSAATLNSFFVLIFLWLIGPILYHEPSQIAFFQTFSFVILLTNYLPEALIAVLIFPPITKVLKNLHQ